MIKKLTLSVIVSGTLLINVSVAENTLKTEKQQQSYALGYNVSSNLKQQGIEVDIDSFSQAIKDVFMSLDQKMSNEDMQKALNDLSESLRNKQAAANVNQGKINELEGLAYMQKNKKDKDVKQTASGLQYKISRLGKGPKPKVTDKVKVHYAGTFIGGKEFDSSYKRGAPATFGLKQVIAGWTEVLQLMPVGSKFQVTIPGNLAYGVNAPSSIGPNRTLLFDIELLAIE